MSELVQHDYTLCDTPESMSAAVKTLTTADYLAFDCEGQSLGEIHGRLSTIALAALPATNPHVFLFDAVALENQLDPVLELLRSTKHTKVVFDGRMDFSELLHRHNTHLTTVLDLQLADIESRSSRGEDLDFQLARLSPYLRRNEVSQQRRLYLAVHRLNGLAGCVKEHKVVDDVDEAKPEYFDHDQWTKRPLDVAHLQYAVGDIVLIARLHSVFVQKGFINESTLLDQSRRYISLHQRSLRSPGEGHPLLPLDILAPPSGYTPMHTCQTCKRSLSLASFSNVRTNCWVCRAIKVRPQPRDSPLWDDDLDDGDCDDYNTCYNYYDSDHYDCDDFF